MKKLLLLALLCFSVNVFAFKWEKIFVDKFGSAQYVDIEDVKKKRWIFTILGVNR